MDGVLNINKPAGMTSHDVVQRVRAVLKEKRVGHTGTLDPMATGVLVLCAGKATRIARFLEAGVKEYQAVLRLGISTDTLDAEGKVLETRAYDPPSRQAVSAVLRSLTGPILQQPPVYSAIKVAGVPSYKRARSGTAEPLAPRTVVIHHLALTSYDDPLIGLEIRCSKGTYIRSLCADIGNALGMGGHLANLVRTRSGRFTLAQSVTLEQLAEAAQAGRLLASVLIPLDDALAEMPSIRVPDADVLKITHGNRVACPAGVVDHHATVVRLHDQKGNLIAIADVSAGMLRPDLVFSS